MEHLHISYAGRFFFYIDVPEAHETIQLWLTAAFDKGWFTSECPANLLYFYEQICRLLEAANLFNQKNISSHPANWPLPDDLNQLPGEHLYCKGATTTNNWLQLPRHLTPGEFYEPFRVFAPIFQYKTMQEWRVMLYELLYQALSPNDYTTAGMPYNLLTIQKHLLKLLEAARLIVLRGPEPPATLSEMVVFELLKNHRQRPLAA